MQNALVVKLGGSSAASQDLAKWIGAIERATMPLVLVPGGGPFANAIRRYQPRIGFDDMAAHAMAVLAMEQFGWALASLGTRLERADSLEALAGIVAADRIPIWMPFKMALADPTIETSWSVTSDGLAAWLAAKLGARRLCLIKQLDLPADSDVQALMGARIVDDSFARHLSPQTSVFVAGPNDLKLAGARLAERQVPGRPVACRPVADKAAAE